MTKEALRQRLLRGRGASKGLEETILETCATLQIELHEADGNVILDMPSFQFDLVVGQLTRRYEAQAGQAGKKRKEVGVFG